MKPLSGRQDYFYDDIVLVDKGVSGCWMWNNHYKWCMKSNNGGLMCSSYIASFPGLFTVQFLIACSTASDQKLDASDQSNKSNQKPSGFWSLAVCKQSKTGRREGLGTYCKRSKTGRWEGLGTRLPLVMHGYMIGMSWDILVMLS